MIAKYGTQELKKLKTLGYCSYELPDRIDVV